MCLLTLTMNSHYIVINVFHLCSIANWQKVRTQEGIFTASYNCHSEVCMPGHQGKVLSPQGNVHHCTCKFVVVLKIIWQMLDITVEVRVMSHSAMEQKLIFVKWALCGSYFGDPDTFQKSPYKIWFPDFDVV